MQASSYKMLNTTWRDIREEILTTKVTRIYSSQSSVSEIPRGLEYYDKMTGKFLLSSEFNASIFAVKEIKKCPNRNRVI